MGQIYCKQREASLSLPRNQSYRSANVTNWPVKWKGCEIKYILTDDKAFLLLVVMDVTSTKFLSLFDSNQTSELKISGLGEGSDSSMLWIIQ